MKKTTRILSALMALVLLIGMLTLSPVSAGAQAVQTSTVILYLVGSNLESSDGSATWNLVQSMEAGYDENLNYIVITGGSTEWQTEAEYLDGAEEIDPEINQIWKLEGRRGDEEHGRMTLIEPDGLKGFESASMCDPGTMTAFIDYCTANYPADLYDINGDGIITVSDATCIQRWLAQMPSNDKISKPIQKYYMGCPALRATAPCCLIIINLYGDLYL